MPPTNMKTMKQHHDHLKKEKKKWKEANTLKKLAKQNKIKPDLNEIKQKNNTPEPPKQISTVSIAIPSSIIENAQSLELRTSLAGQIARAACIFQVDEIVVYDDCNFAKRKTRVDDSEGGKVVSRACAQLLRILQYLECPQYLRKFFFPMHHDLKFVGILNPLEAPHHLRVHNTFQFREGMVTNKPVKEGRGSKVNIGLQKDVEIDKVLVSGCRCTVKIHNPENTGSSKKLKGVVVAPSAPRKETGVYWGYTVRLANSFAEVFSQSPHKDGYDLTIGTSDRGDSIDEFVCPEFQNLLVVFGGLHGIEAVLEEEEKLAVDDPRLLFDCYLNALPNQGSRTIRTEEAVLVAMASLRPKLRMKNAPPEFKQQDAIACSIDTS